MTERFLEELSANFWPALQTVLYDGWAIRLSGGYTRRSNSVTILHPSTVPLVEKVAYCEDLYARPGLPCIFKVTATQAELDAFLDARGYAAEAPTSVQQLRLGAGYRPLDPEPLSEDWLDGFFQLNGLDPRHRQTAGRMLQANPFPLACLAIRDAGRIVATGLAVVDRKWAGLFDIAVVPERRRQGLGRSITEGLLAWGVSQDATHAFLQVMCDNVPALGLYGRLGFEETYHYWYRRQP